MIGVIHTSRLLLRPFSIADADFICKLLNTPGWLNFIGDKGVRCAADAIAYLENGPLAHYRKHGFGLLMVTRRDDDLALGMCGIIKRSELPHPDLGFAFLPQHEGYGYAFEAAQHMVLEAPALYGLTELLAIVMPENKRSINLLQKLGFSWQGSIRMNQDAQPLHQYRKSLVPQTAL
ncbi:Protein N-acetyltransferase, RimJ/RimL family [Cnuella takakiae]|uniref:Protein N-acetyltransferase, RimJ/RimL family n=1 Tax=Cnuella takakiae TaxID=1302690 RepID=A0A1M5DQM3_9BACT|nr:GNAT family N-acetyltransferase [Cnuella takakiae]OLY94979.1 hypothetical protein BUE76_19985 [Cnuella takakiae]SHF69184.1 Protein N-acetyltransferase, RimJ/RimL family [Cnuella takakiae]